MGKREFFLTRGVLFQCGAPLLLLLGGQIVLQRLHRCHVVVIGCSTLKRGPDTIGIVTTAKLLLLLIVAPAVACRERCGIVQVCLRPSGQRKHAQIAIDLLLVCELIVAGSLGLFLVDRMAVVVVGVYRGGC